VGKTSLGYVYFRVDNPPDEAVSLLRLHRRRESHELGRSWIRARCKAPSATCWRRTAACVACWIGTKIALSSGGAARRPGKHSAKPGRWRKLTPKCNKPCTSKKSQPDLRRAAALAALKSEQEAIWRNPI
jgi:hypothetical protein